MLKIIALDTVLVSKTLMNRIKLQHFLFKIPDKAEDTCIDGECCWHREEIDE